MIYLGALVNCAAVLLGTTLGLLFRKGIPQRLQDTMMQGLALCVFFIGVSGMLAGKKPLVCILSMALGALIGEAVNIDALLNRLAGRLEAKCAKNTAAGSVAAGFTAATLLFCVGAMAVVGSLTSGLQGDHSTLYAKSVIDGLCAVMLTATYGFGVGFSAIPLLLYEGGITLLARFVAPVLTDSVVAEMTCVGSLLIIMLSLNMLGLTKLRVANYLPAILLPLLFCLFL